MIEPMVNTERAAEVLGVTVATLQAWRLHKRYPLPYTKIGRRVMYKASDLQKFIDSNTHSA